MCTTVKRAFNGVLAQDLLSGQCQISDDCLTTTCSLRRMIFLFTLKFNNTIRLLPCHRPFGIHVQIQSPQFSPIIGIFTETATATRRWKTTKLTVTCQIKQTDYGIILGVSF